MNKQKNRLVELLQEAREKSREYFRGAINKALAEKKRFNSKTDVRSYIDVEADYLLANGVIVPPYKVGTSVYVVVSRTSNNKNLYIVEDVITHYRIFDDCAIMCFMEHLGLPDCKWGNVFLTKEEAEAKLKEGVQGCLH